MGKYFILNKKIELNKPKSFLIALLALSFLAPISFSFTEKSNSESLEEFSRKIVLEQLDKINQQLFLSEEIINSNENKKVEQLKKHFHVARESYKKIEFFIEYYSPFEAKFFINGPLVYKVEPEISNVPFAPCGFQVMEEILFGKEEIDFKKLSEQIVQLKSKLKILREHYSTIRIEENKLLESLQLQLVRITCLTLNGYDCTINKETSIETLYALEGLKSILSICKNNLDENKSAKNELKILLNKIEKAQNYLKKNKDSDKLNRLLFMTDYLDPVYQNINTFYQSIRKTDSPINYAINLKSNSIFDESSIRKQFFSVYIHDTLKLNEQAELGRLLFFDPLLSGNNQRACASCHKSEKAFTDGLEKSLAYDGINHVNRNSPTLLNAAYQKLFFHDGRAFNLESQADGVFNNTFEMKSDAKEIISKLNMSDEYKKLFSFAFAGKPDTTITFYAVLKSISEFIKTLDSRNSRFDKYLRGDKHQMNASEKNGYNLFAGKALCGSCHFFPLFNSTVPPMFSDNEFEVIGVPSSQKNNSLDEDIGREKISKAEIQKHAFKTPTLRNIELTAPYMHNGVYLNIDSVLVFYNKGGGVGLGLKLENQTLPFDSLGLTKNELNDIKNFLLTLTDTSHIPKPPNRLPQLNDEKLNKRKIGGEY